VLDFEEYLHLAIHASQKDEHHAALEYLHHALVLSPDDARAIFLLAAEHAELGLYNRAIDGMEKCIALDPNIEMAYYQLGLLYLQMGRKDDSDNMWQSLSESLQSSPLKTFAQGMLIMDSNESEGLTLLNRAAEMQNNNPAFQASIYTVIKLISNTLSMEVNETQEVEETYNTLFLNAYKETKFNDDEN
jgi:tetratricopeptide (TPR) repeat protein